MFFIICERLGGTLNIEFLESLKIHKWPRSYLNSLYVLYHLILITALLVGAIIMIPILQVGKARHGEIE